MCDYSDAYIVVKRTITPDGTNANNQTDKIRVFKNNASFKSCISESYNTSEDAEDLDIVMSMYDLLEYRHNFSMTSGSLWNYYRDKMNDDANGNNDDNYRIHNRKTVTSKFLEFKTKIIESTIGDDNTLGAKAVVPLRYLSNLWRSLNLSLINCEIELDLSWSKIFIMSEILNTLKIEANLVTDPILARAPAASATSAFFQINSTKLYVPVVTLPINNNIKFLENLAQSFKRVIYWNKYKSEITTQLKTTIFRNIYSTFRNIINRLLVLSFKNGYNVKYYMSLAEIKDFNALINNKLFFLLNHNEKTRSI